MKRFLEILSICKQKISKHHVIIFYLTVISSILICFILGSILSVKASENVNLYPQDGIILNTDCEYEWNNKKGYYEKIIYFLIVYEVNNNKYMEKYGGDFFSDCETSTWGGAVPTCCENMIGDDIWLNVNKTDYSVINGISFEKHNSPSSQITFAVFFYLFSVIGFLFLVKVAIVHVKEGEINFRNMPRISLLNREDNNL